MTDIEQDILKLDKDLAIKFLLSITAENLTACSIKFYNTTTSGFGGALEIYQLTLDEERECEINLNDNFVSQGCQTAKSLT